jgi:hypothetical protein
MQGAGAAGVVAVAVVAVDDCLDPAGGGVLVAAVRCAVPGVRRRGGAQRWPVVSVLDPCPASTPIIRRLAAAIARIGVVTTQNTFKYSARAELGVDQIQQP